MLDIIELLDRSKTVKTVCHMHAELFWVVSQTPKNNNKEIVIHNFLDEYFKEITWSESFHSPMVISYDESITIEIFLALHKWFLKQCCNIKNIIFVCPGVSGLSEWYLNYQKLFLEPGFKVLEPTFLCYFVPKLLQSAQKTNLKFAKKELKFYFDFYGGTQGSEDKNFVTGAMLTLGSIGHVEYFAGFPEDLTETDNYLETISHFSNRKTCDLILDAIKKSSLNPKELSLNDKYSLATNSEDHSFYSQRSAFNVVRETFNDTPFLMLTEKTLKPFLQYQVPLPLGYGTVRRLENLGFKFDHSLVDYSYQNEPDFFKRILAVVDVLNNIKNTYTLDQLSNRIYNSKDILEYNYNYIVTEKLFRNIEQELRKELDV